jgi:hypothetical protein
MAIEEADFNYRAWVDRARLFCANLSIVFEDDALKGDFLPTLSTQEIEQLSSDLGLRIPQCLENFWRHGCGGMDFHYSLELDEGDHTILGDLFRLRRDVWGGGQFCMASQTRKWRDSCLEWAKASWVSSLQLEAVRWGNALPVASMPNGDYVALDLSAQSEDPPVIYLCHDDTSLKLAGCFSDFLAHWAEIYYLGPELWLMEPFIGEFGLERKPIQANLLHRLFFDE